MKVGGTLLHCLFSFGLCPKWVVSVPSTPPRPGTFEAPVYERKGPFKLRLNRRAVLGDDSGDDLSKNHLVFEWEEVKGDRQRHSAIRQTRVILKPNDQLEHNTEMLVEDNG